MEAIKRSRSTTSMEAYEHARQTTRRPSEKTLGWASVLTPENPPDYAVAGRYGVQPDGIRGAASLMNSVGVGARGEVRSCIPACSSDRSPLRMLHGGQAVTTFSQIDSPPFERGTRWSSVRRPFVVPQYAQRQPSRAKSARREIFRWIARGTRT